MTDHDPSSEFNDRPPFDRSEFTDVHPASPPSDAELQSGRYVYLRDKDSGKYLNIGFTGWGTMEVKKATRYVIVSYYGNHYIVVADGSYQEKYKGYFLSYDIALYVGAFSNWANACFWETNPIDCSYFPGLYERTFYSNKYVGVNGVSWAIDDLMDVEAVT